MKTLARLAVALGLALAAVPAAAQQDAPSIRHFDAETSSALGRAIYEQDIVAARGTDILLANVRRADLAGMAGWIVVDRDGAKVVRFGRGDMDAPIPSYDITFRGEGEPEFAPSSGGFSEAELAQFRAVALARQGVTQPCSANYNSVILPDPDGEGWLVWMLAATSQPGLIPAGGHYRFTISADGRSVERSDRLSRSCLNLTRPSGEGEHPLYLFLTQIVDDVPVETLVFQSLLYDLPFIIGTPDQKVWQVERGCMETIELND